MDLPVPTTNYRLPTTRSITFGFIHHDPFPYNKQYSPSLNNLMFTKDYETTISVDYRLSSEGNPAKNYNSMIDECETDYLVLTHTDVTFSSDFVENIFKTIDLVPDFGALGIVGISSKGEYHWASERIIKEVETLDCCCIIINKAHGLKFDETIFNDFHLYVEDYCAQVNLLHKRKCYTVLTNSKQLPPDTLYGEVKHEKNFFYHHGFTFGKMGPAWGRYHEYKNKLNMKWNRSIKTT